MHEFVLLVMLIAATLYAVLGGADFGAGLIEPFLGAKGRQRIDVAIAPVWEANHVWLVLLATLAFVGFPSVYAVVTGYLHIPLMLVLLGIVARGTAFTFRHYDPLPGELAAWYTRAFRFGSFLAPLFLGVALAATATGELTRATTSFYQAYVAPWNNWFCWATGAFTCALFAFQGAALLAAEYARGESSLPYLRVARAAHLAAMIAGALVLVAAYVEQRSWFDRLLGSRASRVALVLATLLIPLIRYGFVRGRPWFVRLASSAQVGCVLLGFFGAQFPVLVHLASGDLTVENAAAPESTFVAMTWAIVVGLALILPGTAYLIYVYKKPLRGAVAYARHPK